MDPTISVSMIVKNEQELLGRCLNSVLGVDEVIILDTGSTDKTGEVARQYADKFPSFKYIENEFVWCDDFSLAYNESLKRCSGDWIICIDADEYLQTVGIARIRELIARLPPWIDAVDFPTEDEPDQAVRVRWNVVRLIRNHRGISWKGAIHAELAIPAQFHSEIVFYFGYSPNHKKDPNRALRILLKELEKDPTLSRERFFLAREYFNRGQWEEALQEYSKYLENPDFPSFEAEAWFKVAQCYDAMGETFAARLACLRAIEINPDFKAPLEALAVSTRDPVAAARWRSFAELATNKNVLIYPVGPEDSTLCLGF
jgi:glycosyltransferase involved in cell wall biosynthesis